MFLFEDDLRLPVLGNWLKTNLNKEAQILQYLINKTILHSFPLDIHPINLVLLKPSQTVLQSQEAGSTRACGNIQLAARNNPSLTLTLNAKPIFQFTNVSNNMQDDSLIAISSSNIGAALACHSSPIKNMQGFLHWYSQNIQSSTQLSFCPRCSTSKILNSFAPLPKSNFIV